MLRWFVVAQAAAIERQGAMDALASSHRLVRDNYWHVIVFLVGLIVVETGPALLVALPFGGETTVASFLTLVAVQVITWSFAALATALLYFDLHARRRPDPEEAAEEGAVPQPVPPREVGSIDFRDHADDDRPAGWYVDPENPKRMRYWTGAESGWARRTARTPAKVRQAWDDRG